VPSNDDWKEVDYEEMHEKAEEFPKLGQTDVDSHPREWKGWNDWHYWEDNWLNLLVSKQPEDRTEETEQNLEPEPEHITEKPSHLAAADPSLFKEPEDDE